MAAAFIAMVASYFISVLNRNFIQASMPWTEEIAVYSMTYMALLGTEVGLRDGTQVAVTAVVDKLHGVIRKIVDLIRQVILVGFAFIMIKAGGDLVLKQLQAGQTTPVMKLPMSLMYFSLVLAFGLIFVIQTLHWYSRLQNSERKRETGHECRIDFIFDFYSLPGDRGTGVHLLECGFSDGRGVRGPSGLLHAIAQRIFGGLQSSSIMAIAFFVLAGNLMTKVEFPGGL